MNAHWSLREQRKLQSPEQTGLHRHNELAVLGRGRLVF